MTSTRVKRRGKEKGKGIKKHNKQNEKSWAKYSPIVREFTL
jgi:hypothetical protein